MNNNLTYALLIDRYLNADPKKIMSEHGKSFYFASTIFSKQRLEKIATLYRLCRFIDDCADELPEAESIYAIDSILDDLENPQSLTKFNQLVLQVESWGVKRTHIKELVIGARFDSQGERVDTEADLMIYCYRVAGVVGLMMCPLIGVSDHRGFPHAIDLGIGMQLTNICRDVLEDSKMNRSYIPHQILNASKLKLQLFRNMQKTPAELKKIIASLLMKADLYYKSAYQGISHIPFRPRFVILLAGEVYRHIGIKIKKADFAVLSGRIYLTLWEKILVMMKTLLKVFLNGNFWQARHHDARLHTQLKGLPGTNS